MAAFTPSNSDTDSTFRVSKTTDIAIIMTFMVSGRNYHMIATTVTTVVEFRGLSRAQALAKGDSADYNYNNKEGVKFTSQGGAWMRQDKCEGTECRADPRRINEADMWRVTVTHSSTTVSHSAGWSKSYPDRQ